MPNGYIKTKFFGITLVAFMAVFLLSLGVRATEKTGVAEASIEHVINGESTVISPVVETDFPATIIGLAWYGISTPTIEIRFASNDGWSPWYAPEADEAFERDGWSFLTEPVVADQATRIQYRLGNASEVERVKLLYLGSQSSTKKLPQLWQRLFGTAEASTGVDVISRSEWSADEDWRFSDHEEIWSPEYQLPEKIVIHHTAGSDGGDDPQEVIRGIYYWHAKVLGWGDIGYNYVIDQSGNVYEGRYGGDGVIGAHVYRDKNCAAIRFGGADHEADFNRGTIGIAVLGDYGSKTLSTKVRYSLANAAAYLGRKFSINPNGSGYFIDAVYPNIVGHGDIDCTTCPGKNISNKLDTIRSAAEKVYDTLPVAENPVVKASFVRQSKQPFVVNVGETKQGWVEFRNVGEVTWRNYSYEQPSVIAQKSSALFALAAQTKPVAQLITPNVEPGAIGRFVYSVTAPADQLEVTEALSLKFGDTVLSNTSFRVTAQITGYHYAAYLDNQRISPATFMNSQETVSVQFINQGIYTWQRGDVQLQIFDLGYATSKYHHQSWPTEQGDFDFKETEVKPNELATFTVTFQSPAEPGTYLNIYRLAGIEEMVQQEDRSITRVDSLHQAKLTGYTMPPALLSAWRPTVTFTFRNTGSSTWDKSFGLQVVDIGGAVSRFYNSNWDDRRIATHLVERSVAPGQTGTFSLQLRPPEQAGLYFNMFRLFKDGRPVRGGEFSMVTRVD